eukprot:scaffold21.g2125.t1
MASFAHDRRVIIYPHYIMRSKSVSEGRRIPKDKACENPTAPEILDCVVNGLNLQAEIEDKAYPRDWLIRGRVRVLLRNEDGSPVNPDVANRRTLLLKVAELVPRHPRRAGGKVPPTLEQQLITLLSQPAPGSSGSAGAGSSKQQASKKSSKKKK